MVDHNKRLKGPDNALKRPGSDGDRRLATQTIVHASKGQRPR